ncbi:MAG: hypothetical protein HQ546_06080 [Planctomycetes bacterium]|nr:hypothetical protein [Planctomycetota bacterium]
MNNCWFCAVLVASFVLGCTGRGGSVISTPPASPAQANFDAAWEASLDVLGDYQFRVDRLDRREMLITTFPMTGKSWFELARKDAATFRDALESSLQTIYRTVEVRFVPAEADTYQVKVRVAVSRANRPTIQITNTSEAYKLFSMSPETREPGSYTQAGRQGSARPIPLGCDERLAMKIKADIDKRLGRNAN